MEHMTEEQIAEFKEVYAMLDKNDTGIITVEDLSEVMLQLGSEASEDELKDMVSAVDTEGNGEVSFERFCSIMSKVEREEQLREAFKEFDKNADGFLTTDELLLALRSTLDEEPDMKTIELMMDEADSDGDRRVSFEDFVQMANNYQQMN